MMNQSLLSALADQHMREIRGSTAATQRPHRAREARESLRVRTGWTLVGLGLRLAARPGPGLAGTPGPAGS